MALKCELCGNTEFVKEDGMFVCKGCNTKYSLEEAKKMMNGEVGNVDTSTNDKEKSKIDNIRVLAERAGEQGDSKAAAKYYEQLLMEDPNDWEATFCTTYYDAHNTTIGMMGEAANKVSNVIPTTFRLLEESKLSSEDKFNAYISLGTKIMTFRTMLINNITPNIGTDITYAVQNVRKWVKPLLYMDQTFASNVYTIAQYPCYDDNQRKVMLEMLIIRLCEQSIDLAESSAGLQGLYLEFSRIKEEILKIKKSALDYIKLIEKQEECKKQQAVQEYWKNNPEAKKEIEDILVKTKAELDALCAEKKSKLSEMQKEIKAASTNAEHESLLEEKENIIRELSNLGIFKFKERKACLNALDELNPKIEKIEDEIDKEKEKIEKNYKLTEKNINVKIKELEGKINRLNDELKNPIGD